LGANQPNATIRLVFVDRLVVSQEDKTVNFRVFLSESERTSFKIACAKNRTTMSQQALELIRQWLKTQENETQSPDKKGKGE
jgi:ParG